MRSPGLTATTLVVAVLTVAGCSSRAVNKAGGSETSVVLQLADSDNSAQPSVLAVEHFAAQVEKDSAGSLRIHVVFEAGGSAVPRVESRTIGLVRRGHFDIGVVGARAWDLSGDRSFRALQAPFLITSRRLLNRVVASSVGADMLASLRQEGVVGLALVPEYLRHPIGLTRRLVSLADLARARIRILPSATTSALIRALGATPLEVSNDRIGLDIAHGHVDGEEGPELTAPGGATITGNLVFFGKALTFFANRSTFTRLKPEQRQALQSAATETMRYIADQIPSESELAKRVCVDGRRIVLAKPADVRAIEQAAGPVYAQLEADPATRRFIAQIRAWKRTTPPDPPVVLPPACKHATARAQASGRPSPPSILNGTYRWVLTLADARAHGGPSPGDTFPIVSTAVLADGSWKFAGPDHDSGTYSIHGDRIRFVWPRAASVLVFRFTRDSDGTVHLRPVLPMDTGDQFVWSDKPWRRIGPPGRLAG